MDNDLSNFLCICPTSPCEVKAGGYPHFFRQILHPLSSNLVSFNFCFSLSLIFNPNYWHVSKPGHLAFGEAPGVFFNFLDCVFRFFRDML